ncbi:MAG: septation protein SpoVG family protein [Endomicrobiales bacterium]|nr:septation protein SpoVG family protein [Endomicrobiales bacterium]
MGKKSVILFIQVLAVSALLIVAAFAEEIFVTELSKTGAEKGGPPNYTVTINGVLVIKDVSLEKLGDRPIVRLPVYVSKKGRKYPQVTLLTRQAIEAFREALAGGKSFPGNEPALDFKITGIRQVNNAKSLKAVGTVCFNDSVEVECRVFKGKTGVWIGWPSKKSSGKSGRYEKLVIVSDKTLRESIERQLLLKYDTLEEEEGL